jgi:tetratricopeptide (TPR) repeat protein
MATSQQAVSKSAAAKKAHRPIWALIVLIVIGMMIAAGYLSWRAGQRRALAAASIPARPMLSDKPAQLSQRIRACEDLIRDGPDAVATLGELSQLYHANGFYAEAAQCYRGLLRIDPSNPHWPHRFATILASYGQLNDAVGLWKRTLSLAKNYTPACIHLADALLKLNRSTEAAAIYNDVLKRDPDNPYALVGLARVDIDAGRWTEARARLEKADAKSEEAVGYDLLVNVYEQLGDTVRAQEIRSKQKVSGAFFDVPDPWLREIYSDCYDAYQLSVVGGTAVRERDDATAIQFVERAIALEPTNGRYHLQAATVYKELGNPSAARQELETAVKLAPDLADAWGNLFSLLAAQGQTEQAWQTLTSGLAQCPDSSSLHFLRGRFLLGANRFEDAIPDLKQAAALRPDDASSSFALALIYSRLNRPSESHAALKAALTAEPGYPPALCALARDYIAASDESNARALMQKVEAQPRVPSEERLKLEQAFQQRFGTAVGR